MVSHILKWGQSYTPSCNLQSNYSLNTTKNVALKETAVKGTEDVFLLNLVPILIPVSYTHLDVYKRQH